MTASKIIKVHEPLSAAGFLDQLQKKPPLFICTIASSDTALIPGVSAAGAGPELIPYTAAADVEALYHGRAFCLDKIPENPVGPPSPVIITMAALRRLQAPCLIVDAGNRITPQVPMLTAGRRPGHSMTEDIAVEEVNKLFFQGILIGRQLAVTGHSLILGESVPGGTTTAMALMECLGLKACGRISGSMPGNNQTIKQDLVEEAMRAKNITPGELSGNPLRAVSLFGDPMQPVQAGMAISAAARTSVLLAGGTQMIAVAALTGALYKLALKNKLPAGFGSEAADELRRCKIENLAIATTSWVTEDKAADLRGLMAQLQPPLPLYSSRLDFSRSRHENLRLYEQGYVKEGVGAGAMATAAMLYDNLEPEAFLGEIERVYEEIYLSGS